MTAQFFQDRVIETPPAPGSEPGPTRLSYGYARRNGVMLQARPEGLVCIHRRSAPLAALLEVRRLHDGAIAFEAVEDAAFDNLLREQTGDAADAAADITVDGTDLATLAEDAAAIDDLLDSRDDAPVVRLINAILLQAVREGVSDVHIETEERRLVVRYRVDGVLREVLSPPRSLAPLLVSRIKVMARLDIAEKRAPHDGRVTLRIGGMDVDVRVSTIPTQHGERVVLRLLDRNTSGLDLGHLGMEPRDLAALRRMIQRPHGIVLVTGPTGSGKTTTLYAALTELNDRKRNIMTVEDPVEYALEGVGQMQVNSRIDLTFARGLRAILRQDPDVIMVGEIRDQETAEVAVRSSMTGHLVLSTLHTNSAVGSVTRLVDMGVERYLLAPMLTGLIAQRLVRRLCPECRQEEVATAIDAELTSGAVPFGSRVFRPVGCSVCRSDGYRGRTGLYEVIEIDPAFQAMVHDGASEADLVRRARTSSRSILEDGAAKIANGQTSVAEVVRVVREDG